MHILMTISADPPRYLSWGWASVSVPNLIAILVTVTLFVLAVVLPFPGGHEDSQDES